MNAHNKNSNGNNYQQSKKTPESKQNQEPNQTQESKETQEPKSHIPPDEPKVESEKTQESDTLLSKDERIWGMLCHLSAFAGLIFPFGNLIGPFVIWLLKRDEMPFVAEQGKESLNFQITVTIALILSGLLMFAFIGIILLPLIGLYSIVMIMIATMKANEGIHYRYPYSLHLL